MKSTTSTADADQELALLLEQVSELIVDGDLAAAEALIDQCPSHADRLRRMLPAMAILSVLDEPNDNDNATPPTPTADTNGSILGDFRNLREIGRGGMGVVYAAEQVSLGRRVALKVLPFAAMLDKQQLNRFKNEARAAGTLDHPHIVSVYSVGTQRGFHYYAMQLIEGQSLAEVIASRQTAEFGQAIEDGELTTVHDAAQRDPERTRDTRPVAGLSTAPNFGTQEYFRAVAELGIQAAQALDHAHQNGVVHRDVKPGNLLVDAEGKLWVTDFGLARIEAEAGMTMTGDLLGTLRYMSPEQALGKRAVVDHRTDIYSLGATLYELLTLRPVYRGATRQELLRQIAGEQPRPLRQVNSQIPVDLATIVDKSLERSPADRYRSAHDLADDLQRFVENQPIIARPPSMVQKVAKWSRRNLHLVGASVAILLVILGGLAAGIMILGQAFSETERHRQQVIGQRNQLQEALYVADVRLAQKHWNEGDTFQTRALLSRHIPRPGQRDLRGWEWFHLQSLAEQNVVTLQGHADRVLAVAWSPDGARIASGGWDQTVRVWDANRHQELLTLRGVASDVLSLAWSPDGKRLAAVGAEGPAVLWEIATGREVYRFARDAGGEGAVAWHPDQPQLAVTDSDRVIIWDVANHVQLQNWDTPPTKDVAWSPDGTTLAGVTKNNSSLYREFRLWEAKSGREILRKSFEHTVELSSPAWSPDGKRIAFAVDRAEGMGSVLICDVATGEREQLITGRPGAVYTVAWSGNRNRLAAAGADGIIRIYDVASGRESHVLRGHGSAVRALSWNPDGRRLCSAADGRTVKIWDSTRQADYQQLEGSSRLAWSPDGRRLACKAVAENFFDPAVSTHDAETSVEIFDVTTGERALSLPRQHRSWLGCMDWSPDGSRLAAGTQNDLVVWDPISGRELIRRTTPTKDNVAWCPDRMHLAIADTEQDQIEILAIESQQTVAAIPYRGTNVYAICWHPAGQQLAAKIDDVVHVWEIKTGRQLLRLELHPRRSGSSSDVPESVAWSPDGNRLAAGTADGAVLVWDARTGRQSLVFTGHTGSVWCVAWHPDGDRIASGGTDWQLKVWDALTGQEVLSFQEAMPIAGVAWDPSGRHLASVSGDSARIRIRSAAMPAANAKEASVPDNRTD